MPSAAANSGFPKSRTRTGRLSAAQARCARAKRGVWLDWLDREFGWSERAAYRFSEVAEAFGGKVATLENLEIDAGALYFRSGPHVPPAIRRRPGTVITTNRADCPLTRRDLFSRVVFRIRPGLAFPPLTGGQRNDPVCHREDDARLFGDLRKHRDDPLRQFAAITVDIRLGVSF